MKRPIPKFRGRIEDGRLISKEADKFTAHLKTYKDGTLVDYFVKKIEPTRSDPLRKYYWKWVMGPIQDWTGESKDVIHESCKSKFASYEDKFGIIHKRSVFSNVSDMTVIEKKQFIKDVRYWARDFLGVNTPEFEPRTLIY